MINKKVAAVADAVREVLLQTESVSKKHKESHEKNMDAAQREMDRRHEDGEDMTGAKIHPTTYEIIKPKSKMKEELSPKQKKIAALAGDPKKIDAEDFKKLRGEEINPAMSIFSRIMEKVAERELDEAFPTVADVHKKANAPKPSGGAGIKQGTRYGGGRQAPDVEPEEDDEKKPFTRMSGAHKNRRTDTKLYKEEELEEGGNPPWDGPSTKTKGNVKDKSGAVHTPASRAKDSAQKGMKTFAQKRKELDETLSKKAPPADWIHDFIHSDNPQFAGKSKAKRQKMALAAYYAKQRNEESDCVTPPQAKKIAKKEVKGHEKTMHHNEEVNQIEEGRPSQQHPLEGHDYHKKSNAELTHIAKDAHKAAEAMKGHNTKAENKYRDQANDSATVRYWRQKHGTPEWYKTKYNLKEEVEIKEGRKPEKDDHEPHPTHGDIGLTKGDVRDTAYKEGERHAAGNKHGSNAKAWGPESKHYSAGFMAGRNDSDKWHKKMSKITRTEEFGLDEGRGPTTQVDEPFVTSDSKPLQNAKDLAKSTMKRIKTEMMGKTGTSE